MSRASTVFKAKSVLLQYTLLLLIYTHKVFKYDTKKIYILNYESQFFVNNYSRSAHNTGIE